MHDPNWRQQGFLSFWCSWHVAKLHLMFKLLS
jgi:hypothetical protein